MVWRQKLLNHSPSLVLDKANVRQLSVAADALEAGWVPTLAHGTDHSTNHKLTWSVDTVCGVYM